MKYILLLISALCFAQVPITNPKFSDICLEIYGNANTNGKTLSGAFASATGTFNAAYNTGLNSLLKFRGYKHTIRLTIGQAYQGGIIVHLEPDGVNGLIMSNTDIGTAATWNNGVNVSTGATDSAYRKGEINTDKIITVQGEFRDSYAAGKCHVYVSGIYTDWFLPSYLELFQIYVNRGSLTSTNLLNAIYWTSSESNTNQAKAVNPITGSTLANTSKNDLHNVRAVRYITF